MPYTHLNYGSLQDARLKEVFHHADLYLFDVYGMFRGLPPAGGDGGGGNFSMVLVLLCMIDGLAAEVWPGRDQGEGSEQRFKRFIRCKLPWGPEGKGKWLDKGNAADQLYTEFRNPMVHELAKDKAASSRPAGYEEPIIGRWGLIPDGMHDIGKIDALPVWDVTWPILSESRDAHGAPRYKLTAAGLYWGVKKLAQDLLVEVYSASN